MTKEQLLAEIEDLLRTMPPRVTIRHDTPENFAWLGRLSAVIESWDSSKSVLLMAYFINFRSSNPLQITEGYSQLVVLLHQAQNDLRMQTQGPANVAIPRLMVFHYFDEIRKIIELAR